MTSTTCVARERAGYFCICVVLLFLAFLRSLDAAEPIALNPNEDWLVLPGSDGAASVFDATSSVGRITRIDATNIETEDRLKRAQTRFERPCGGGVLLKPQAESEDVEKRVHAILEERRRLDYIWLRNGDEFFCDFLALDKRFAYIRAFDVDVRIPRGRVAAIRFHDVWNDQTNAGTFE